MSARRLPSRVLALAFLAALLGLADAGVIALDRRRASEEAPLAGTLLSANPVAVHKLTIARAHRPPVVLERQAAGWVVASHRSYPTRAGRVDALVQRLLSWRRERVAGGKPTHESFGVTTERAIDVKLEDAQGRTIGELLVGTLTGVDTEAARQQSGHVDPGTLGRCVRVLPEDDVYVVADFISSELEPDPGEWLERPLIAVEEAKVRALALRRGDETLLLRLDPQDPRLGDGRPLDVDRARGVVRDALALAPVDLCAGEDDARLGLAPPRATLELAVEGSPLPVHVVLGEEIAPCATIAYPGLSPPETGFGIPVVPARVSGRPGPVLLPAAAVKRLLEAPGDLALAHAFGEHAPDAITRIELVRKSGAIVLAQDHGWTVTVVAPGAPSAPRKLEGPAGLMASKSVLELVTQGLAVTGFERAPGSAHGLADPAARILVELGRKDRLELAIGAPESGRVWARRADLPACLLALSEPQVHAVEVAFEALAH